jgi:hypothetical protein
MRMNEIQQGGFGWVSADRDGQEIYRVSSQTGRHHMLLFATLGVALNHTQTHWPASYLSLIVYNQ